MSRKETKFRYFQMVSTYIIIVLQAMASMIAISAISYLLAILVVNFTCMIIMLLMKIAE